MRWFLLVLGLLAACKGGPRAGETSSGGPEALVRRAIDAAGGAEALASIQAYHMETEGTHLGQPYTSISHFRAPNDWRWVMSSSMMSMSGWVLGPDMDVYQSMGGAAMRLEGAMRDQWIQHMQVGNAAGMPSHLLAPGVTLEEAEPVMAGGVKCAAVAASFDGAEPAIFAFDPETGLVRQVRFQMMDESGDMTEGVMDLSDWQDVDGVTIPHHMEMVWNSGDTAYTLTDDLVAVEWNPDIPDEILAAPEVAATPQLVVVEQGEARVAMHVFVGPYDQVPAGIQKVMAWIGQNGGRPAGPPALIYPPPPADMTKARTIIHVPVDMPAKPELMEGDVRLMKVMPWTFAAMPYEGPVSGCWQMFGPVMTECMQKGYRKAGPFRVVYTSPPDEAMNCTALVGMPVRNEE